MPASPPRGRPRRLARLAEFAGLAGFARDERGVFAPLMALALVPLLVGLIGLTLDATRLYVSRAALQSAVDNAALAGAGAFGRGAGDMQRLARAYLDRAAAAPPPPPPAGTRVVAGLAAPAEIQVYHLNTLS